MRLLTVILLILSTNSIAQNSLKTILDELDAKISQREHYYEKREERIKSLHFLLNNTADIKNRYTILRAINKEYLPYNSDSALYYSTKCVNIANNNHFDSLINEAKIIQAKSLVLLGLYSEANNVLASVDVKKATKKDKIEYYVAQVALNRFKNAYIPHTDFFLDYDSIRASYQDTLLTLLNINKPRYKVTKADRKKDIGDYSSMRDIMLETISKLTPNDRAYGYTAYTLADAYGLLNDDDNKIKYLALSSISDIINGVRENSSLRELALLMFNKGDIAHSNKYIRIAFSDAIYSNAKLRSHEVLKILPSINAKYEEMINRMSRNKTIFGTILGLLSIILIIAFYYILKQKMKLQEAFEHNRVVNKQILELNNTLEENNKKIQSYNKALQLLNKNKEDYIAHYLKLSSYYIKKIDDFRKMLYKKAQKDKKEDLIKTLRSNDFVNNELKSFYKDFDKSFIELYPNFVEEFNKLLKEDQQIILKPNEILNTELRIFALIRLGITDSAQIANFLRYSVTTIYNYRTKTRNSSLFSKNEFIAKVRVIGI